VSPFCADMEGGRILANTQVLVFGTCSLVPATNFEPPRLADLICQARETNVFSPWALGKRFCVCPAAHELGRRIKPRGSAFVAGSHHAALADGLHHLAHELRRY
jgi:hypothetical protein